MAFYNITKNANNINIVDNDNDWMQIWVNGRKIFEGHSLIQIPALIHVLENLNGNRVQRTLTEEFEE